MLKKLESYVSYNGRLDASTIQNDWFPDIRPILFLSHSHRDQATIIQFAKYLFKNFRIIPFIDSLIWNDANALIDKILTEYCIGDTQEIIRVSSHVHVMLCMALAKVIDNSECLFFFNTPNALPIDDVIKGTESPWLYHEIGISKIVHKRKRMFAIANERIDGNLHEKFKPTYRLELEHLADMGDAELDKWAELVQSRYVFVDEYNSLEMLYDMVCPLPTHPNS